MSDKKKRIAEQEENQMSIWVPHVHGFPSSRQKLEALKTRSLRSSKRGNNYVTLIFSELSQAGKDSSYQDGEGSFCCFATKIGPTGSDDCCSATMGPTIKEPCVILQHRKIEGVLEN